MRKVIFTLFVYTFVYKLDIFYIKVAAGTSRVKYYILPLFLQLQLQIIWLHSGH